MDDQEDIGALSGHCMRGFDQLIESLANCPEVFQRDMSVRNIENDFGRFKIWCGNLGALQRGRGSLDVRLRGSTVMRDTIMRFLDQLQESLKQSIELTTQSRTPWEELERYSEDEATCLGAEDEEDDQSDTSDESTSELAERQSEIRDTITHLYRLSFKMRNASHRLLPIRALSMKHVDPETGGDLFSGYATYDYQYVLESLQQLRQGSQLLTPDLQPVRKMTNDIPTFLLERLSRAITNRRRCFAYWRRHALKLSRIVNEPLVPRKNPVTSEELKSGGLGAKSVIQAHEQDGFEAQLIQIPGPETTISGTDISKYQSNLDDYLDTETVISYATTAKDVDGKSADLPPAPADASSKPEFVCPYCWVACPSRQGKGKSWRMHILQDLQPYVCTYPDCPDGDRLYVSRGAWMEHERLYHRRVWRCFEQRHSNILYKSQEQLHHHLSENHTDLTELQIQSLLELIETTTADSREVCPFCDSTGPFDKGLYNHMAFHQENFAIFAAPRNVNDDNDEANSGSAHGIRSTGSLRSISLRFSNTSDTSVKTQDEGFSDVLYAASRDGDQELVKELLNQGPNFNMRGGEYDDALYIASEKGHEAIIRLLLNAGANVNAEGGEDSNALRAASNSGHEAVVKLLLDAGANVNPQSEEYGRYDNPLHAASEEGHEAIVKLLLNAGADVNAQNEEYGNALLVASAKGHEQVVKILLDKGADVNAQDGNDGNALQAASEGGHEQIVKILLDKGADVHARGGYYGNVLQAASVKGHEQVVKILLDKGADVNARGGYYGNALQAASVKGHEQVVKILLDKGADVNARGGYYGNALQAASVKGHEQVIKMLVDAGAG